MDTADFMPGAAAIAGIKKNIEAYEARRASVMRQVRWRVPLFIALVLIAVMAIARLFNGIADPYEQWLSTPHVFLYFFGFLGVIAMYYVGMKPASDFQQSFRDTLLPVVFSFIQDVTYRRQVTPDSFDRLPREAVGAHSRQYFDDVITGRYDGFPFELYEAKFYEGSGKSKTATFQGVIVVCETTEPFPGVLVAARRTGAAAGLLRGMFRARLEELKSGDAELDGIYEFRTDNVAAAQPLVKGRLAQVLTWLGETRPADPARIALSGSDGFLLLPQTRNFFELPPISTPLDYQTHIAPMIADMGGLLATAALVRKIGEGGDAVAAS